MDYRTLLNAVDTKKALDALQLAPSQNGAYYNYVCLNCGKTARIKRYGVGKNLSYCNHCKDGSNIAKLVKLLQYPDMDRETAWPVVQKYLQDKAMPFMYRKNTRTFTTEYTLAYNDILEKHGLTKEFCEERGIGKVKGQSVMAGHIAVKLFNDDGVKVGYFGINMKTDKIKFSHNNPDHTLYNYCNIDTSKEVIFISDIWKCLQEIQAGKQAISNYSMEYISIYHYDLLQRCEKLLFYGTDSEIMKQYEQMKTALKAA